MFGWLRSLFGSEPEAERIVPPPLPSKVKKAEKLVGKKIAKKAGTKKEASKKEAPVEKVAKVPAKAPAKKKETVKPVAESASKKKGGRPKKSAETVVSVEPVQTEQNLPNS